MKYDTNVELKNLLKAHGSSEFGNICQTLLELTLKEMGYNTRGRNTERPDIVARKEGHELSIECKCPAGSFLSLTERDLEGIMELKDAVKIVATIVLDLKPFWILANATKLKADKYSKIVLKSYDFSDISQEVNMVFPKVLNRYYEITLKRGVEGLRTRIK
jgi:Holliday junction resolvase